MTLEQSPQSSSSLSSPSGACTSKQTNKHKLYTKETIRNAHSHESRKSKQFTVCLFIYIFLWGKCDPSAKHTDALWGKYVTHQHNVLVHCGGICDPLA